MQLNTSGNLKRGERVAVRRASEILATLGDQGALDGLPFMPEMADLCGRQLRVHRLADRTCVEEAGLRRMERTVLLEGARCDGSAHDGCQRACLIFWKEAWLRRDDVAVGAVDPVAEEAAVHVLRALPTRYGELYLCQSTALKAATSDLSSGSLRYLIQDVRRGELSLARLVEIVGRTLARSVLTRLGLPEIGAISGPDGGAKSDTGFQPGERVRVKSRAQIAATLDREGKNRGLTFEPEMTPYAGKVFKVAFPVTRMIHEVSGRMVSLRSTVTLEGVDCQGRCTRNCPRANPLFWREVWLERVDN